jgi:hypothetical protein
MADFPEYEIQRSDDPLYLSEGGLEGYQREIIEEIDRIRNADIVIADIKGNNPKVAYQIGVRHSADRPTLHITSDPTSLPEVFRYRQFFSYFVFKDATSTRRMLKSIIERADYFASELCGARRPTFFSDSLSDRIITIADGISELRINSIAPYVDQLRKISEELRDQSHADGSKDDLVDQILKILSSIDEMIGSSRLGKLVVSGALAALVTGGGLAAAAVFSLSIAAWEGPKYFRAALDKYLSEKKAALSKPAGSRRSSPKPSAPRGSQRRTRPSDDTGDKPE